MFTNKTKEINYFDEMSSSAKYTSQATALLNEMVKDLSSMESKLKEIHEVEHNADINNHKITNALNQAFITPIEREDIMSLSCAIDDVVDSVEEIALQFYMLNITTLRQEAFDFIDIISDSCKAVQKAVDELKNFKKSKTLINYLIEINNIEEKGDKLYQEAIRRLFTESEDAIEIIKWRKIFEIMEACCDACEDVSDLIEGIMLKNS